MKKKVVKKVKKKVSAVDKILNKDIEKLSNKALISHYNMLRDYLEKQMSQLDQRILSIVLETERELTLRETD